jgi:hypothetical protein
MYEHIIILCYGHIFVDSKNVAKHLQMHQQHYCWSSFAPARKPWYKCDKSQCPDFCRSEEKARYQTTAWLCVEHKTGFILPKLFLGNEKLLLGWWGLSGRLGNDDLTCGHCTHTQAGKKLPTCSTWTKKILYTLHCYILCINSYPFRSLKKWLPQRRRR